MNELPDLTRSPPWVIRASLSRDCVVPWRAPYGFRPPKTLRFGKPSLPNNLSPSSHGIRCFEVLGCQSFLRMASMNKPATRCGPGSTQLRDRLVRSTCSASRAFMPTHQKGDIRWFCRILSSSSFNIMVASDTENNDRITLPNDRAK